MKVQRTAERLAHIVNLHKRALVELSKVGVPRSGPVDQSVSAQVSSSASSELRPRLSRQCELRPVELRTPELSAASSSSASPSPASLSNQRPCELRPEASSASSELRPELRPKRAEPVKRESPLRKFASVASQSQSIKSASVNPVSVALLRPPKRSLH
jgi:hypothetical protein